MCAIRSDAQAIGRQLPRRAGDRHRFLFLCTVQRSGRPPTGRKVEFRLLPLSAAELLTQESPLESRRRLLERRRRYGAYPGVITSDNCGAAILEISNSYLYRDALEYRTVKIPTRCAGSCRRWRCNRLEGRCTMIWATLLGLDKNTIARYVDLLEKAFVIFHLPPLSRNLHERSWENCARSLTIWGCATH